MVPLSCFKPLKQVDSGAVIGGATFWRVFIARAVAMAVSSGTTYPNLEQSVVDGTVNPEVLPERDGIQT